MGTTHHCPGLKSASPCTSKDRVYTGPTGKEYYCGKHQNWCSIHNQKHMKQEECPKCKTARETVEKDKKAKERKDKEDKEKKKRELAEKQSAKDKAPLSAHPKTVGGKGK